MLTIIFKRYNYIYIINEDTVEEGWLQLAKRQSMSIENCKKQYKLIFSSYDEYKIHKIKIN